MKQLLFVCLLSIAGRIGVSAQETEMPSTMASVFNQPRQFFFFDFTQTNWLNAPAGVKSEFISGGWNFNFLYEINVIPTRLGIAPGISYAVTGVKSNAIFSYEYNGDDVTYTNLVVTEDSAISKSKLSTSFIEIPLEIHIHSNASGARNKSFLIAPGFRAGVMVGDFWKLTILNPPFSKIKIYDIENVSPFRYGVSLRLMFYKFGLFGYYQLNHLFEKDKGPQITPVSFGITVSPF